MKNVEKESRKKPNFHTDVFRDISAALRVYDPNNEFGPLISNQNIMIQLLVQHVRRGFDRADFVDVWPSKDFFYPI